MRPAVFKVFLFLALCGTEYCSSNEGTADAGADAGLTLSCEGKHTGDSCGDAGVCIKPSDGGSCYPAIETECWPICDMIGSRCIIGATCDGVCYWMGDQINACIRSFVSGNNEFPYCGDIKADPCRSAPNAGCPTGSTCLDTEDGTTCWKICNTKADCQSSEECIDTELGFNLCVVVPPRLKVGEICVHTSECVDGASCINRGGTKRCYEVCTDTCTNGTCTDIGMDYNICLVDASDGGGHPD